MGSSQPADSTNRGCLQLAQYDVLRCPSWCWGICFSLVLKMRFPPSVVESEHGWRTAMHLQGRNGVENRNEACVMEVASLGSLAKMRTKEGGKLEGRSLGWVWNEMECQPQPY